jgi:hypothetical protein
MNIFEQLYSSDELPYVGRGITYKSQEHPLRVGADELYGRSFRFVGEKGKKSLRTDYFEEPKKEDYLSAGEVLGRPTAKNTAQRGISESQQMKDAYDSLMKGAELFKDKGFQDKFTALTTRPASPAERLMHIDTSGRVPLNAEEWQKKGLAPLEYAFGSTSGVGASITQAPQTSTSNIAPSGFKPVTMEQAQAGLQKEYGVTGSEREARSYAAGEYKGYPGMATGKSVSDYTRFGGYTGSIPETKQTSSVGQYTPDQLEYIKSTHPEFLQ